MFTHNNHVISVRKPLAVALAFLLLLTAGMSAAYAGTAVVITLAEAKSIALQHAQLTEADVFLTKQVVDYDKGRMEFEIDFVAGGVEYEFEINAADGSILKTSTERAGGKMKDLDVSLYIGFDKAIEIALADGGFTADRVTLVEVQFDFEKGLAEYEVEYTVDGVEYQFDMDAITGEVLKREMDRR